MAVCESLERALKESISYVLERFDGVEKLSDEQTSGVLNFIQRKDVLAVLPTMVGGMVQNSTNQNHHQHQQPICSSTFFFYINNKIRPTSTINIIINHRNMPNSTTRENQHQQKFLFSSTKICLTTNIGHRLQQQNTFNNLGTNDWLWSREVGTQKF